MPNPFTARDQRIRIAVCLALIAFAAGAQSGMSRDEAAQLYTAAGFPISGDRPVNRCGKPAKPRVTFVDINADKQPEALFIDADACYAPSGSYFAVLTKEGAQWRSVINGDGSIQALSTTTAGWLDMRVDSSCVRNYQYDGRAYVTGTQCPGDALSGTPQPAQPAPAAQPVPVQPTPAQPAGKAGTTLNAGDEAAAFKAAGFTRRGDAWGVCDDPTATYSPGAIDTVADLNGDGLPEAVLIEGGTYCYGNVGQGFWLVSKGSDSSWTLVTSGTGIPQFLTTKGSGGWPDISVGGPGFCFPVERWTGAEYKLQRWEYEGKACEPPR